MAKQNERGLKSRNYKFRRGTTAWTKESVRSLIVKEEVKSTTGAGKAQGAAEAIPVAAGAGPGGAEGMDIDGQKSVVSRKLSFQRSIACMTVQSTSILQTPYFIHCPIKSCRMLGA